MKEQLISFETAKLAKEKGFGGKELTTLNGYFRGGVLCNIPCNNKSDFCHEDEFSAPTQSLLQKWLRETHQLHLEIQVQDYVETPKFYWNIFGAYKNNKMIICIANSPREDYVSYEEALEAGLQKALSCI